MQRGGELIGEILLGLPALYIGGVLVVALLVLMGYADQKGASIFIFLVAFLATAVGFYNWLVLNSPLAMAQVLLFAFTYWILGYSWYTGAKDNRTLGWYCLFVAINVIPFAYYVWDAGMYILGVNWVLWGLAWFMFWVVMGIQKTQFMKLTLIITWIAAIVVWFCALGWLLGWFGF